MFANLASDQVSEGIVRPDAQENADDEHAAPRVGQRCAHDYDARKEKTCVRRTEKAHADIGTRARSQNTYQTISESRSAMLTYSAPTTPRKYTLTG